MWTRGQKRNYPTEIAMNRTILMEVQETEIGDDLVVRKLPRAMSGPGTWVWGRLNGYRFEALVFPEHAACADWEFGESRISKLWIQRLADRREVFNWDRGADVPAADAE